MESRTFMLVAVTFLWTQKAVTADYGSCDWISCGSYEYCCGDNVCCTDWGALWFVWFIIAVFVISLIACCSCAGSRRARLRREGLIVQGQPATIPRNTGYTYAQTTVVHPQQPVPYPYYPPTVGSQYGAVQQAAPIQYQAVQQQAGPNYHDAPPPYYQKNIKMPSAPPPE